MSTRIVGIVKDALEIQCEAFAQLARDTTQLLCGENGRVGNLSIDGRLVKINPSGQALVIGDLHGDLESLIDILRKSDYLKELDGSQNAYLVFLGDYGDRGAFSAEVYCTIMILKTLFPRQVVLMRGNHEGPHDLMAEPHDLPAQFQKRFGENWHSAYAAIRNLFDCLYTCVLVEGRYLLVHGGLPQQLDTLEELAYAHKMHPRNSLLEDMLWSDPVETVEETYASPRGAGRLFGQSVTDRMLAKLGVKVLIRSHESCPDGFKVNHGGKVLTVFSRKGSPYFNPYGVYLEVELSGEVENANQLIPYVHQF